MPWCVDNFFFSLKEEQLFYNNILVSASQNSESHQKNLMLMMWPSGESACFREEESSCEVKQHCKEKFLNVVQCSAAKFSVCHASFKISWEICIT